MAALTLGFCFSCERDGIPVHDVRAVSSAFKACFGCLRKWSGRTLRDAANRIVAARTPQGTKFGTCRHCGEKVCSLPAGGYPLICQACEAEWRSMA